MDKKEFTFNERMLQFHVNNVSKKIDIFRAQLQVYNDMIQDVQTFEELYFIMVQLWHCLDIQGYYIKNDIGNSYSKIFKNFIDKSKNG